MAQPSEPTLLTPPCHAPPCAPRPLPQCEQLASLLPHLPAQDAPGAASLRVELCTMFWARTVDRGDGGWMTVMAQLSPKQQVCTAAALAGAEGAAACARVPGSGGAACARVCM